MAVLCLKHASETPSLQDMALARVCINEYLSSLPSNLCNYQNTDHMATNQQPRDSLSALPEELLAMIVDHLAVEAMSALSQTSRKFNRLSDWRQAEYLEEMVLYLLSRSRLRYELRLREVNRLPPDTNGNGLLTRLRRWCCKIVKETFAALSKLMQLRERPEIWPRNI